MSLRSEHRLPSDNSAKTHRPGLIGSAEPRDGQMARISELAYTTGDKNMTNTTAANGKEAAYHGVPAEDDYGYAQAIKIGNTIHVSGQLSQDDKGAMIAPAALDESGKPADFSMMAEQMRVTYANAAKILAQFGATLDHVVEETLYVIDVDEAFAVAGKVRKEAYAKARPQCASNLIGVSRLAFPEQLIEIVFKAVLPPADPVLKK
jgi:enamine deaminase RidA (YjgF/YER057c/UK114 family)